MSPTYDALKKLATGLEIPVPQLFTPPRQTRANGRMTLTPTGAGEVHATATYEHELLGGAMTQKAMLPYPPASGHAIWRNSMAGRGTTERSA